MSPKSLLIQSFSVNAENAGHRLHKTSSHRHNNRTYLFRNNQNHDVRSPVFNQNNFIFSAALAVLCVAYTAIAASFLTLNIQFAEARTTVTASTTNTLRDINIDGMDFFNSAATSAIIWSARTSPVPYDGTPYNWAFTNCAFGDPSNTNPTKLSLSGPTSSSVNAGPIYLTIANNNFRYSFVWFDENAYIPVGSVLNITNNTFTEFPTLYSVFNYEFSLISFSCMLPTSGAIQSLLVANNVMTVNAVYAPTGGKYKIFVMLAPWGPFGGYANYKSSIQVVNNSFSRTNADDDEMFLMFG
eukprot:PhF_6_TR28040/c1_g1_i2/m.41442